MAAPLAKAAAAQVPYPLKACTAGLMTLSIVVPVFNEADALPDLIQRLQALQSPSVEIIFVDGGSTDTTVAQLRSAGLPTLSSCKGRAWQMNAGALHSRGDILLFLHADTQLPEQALDSIRQHITADRCWGRFDVQIAGRSKLLPVVAHMMNWRSRWTGIATGDQALFMQRSAFNQVKGFPEQALMEDIEMSRRLLGLSRPVCLRHKVTTSGRRWDAHGAWATVFLMWRLRWAYWLGHNADSLAQRY
jgi:rSAM/selenodomain-associated transferase 2